MVRKGLMRIFQTSGQELDVFYALASKEIFNLALLIKFLTLNIAFICNIIKDYSLHYDRKVTDTNYEPSDGCSANPHLLGGRVLSFRAGYTFHSDVWVGKGACYYLSRKIKCLFGNQAQNRSHLHEWRHTYVFFFYLAHLNSKTFPRNMDTSFYNYIIVFLQTSSVNQLLNKNKSHRGEVV